MIAGQHVQVCIGRRAESERLRVVGVREDGREWVRAQRCGLDARDPVHRDGYLERILAQCRMPRSKKSPRLMSPMLTMPRRVPL